MKSSSILALAFAALTQASPATTKTQPKVKVSQGTVAGTTTVVSLATATKHSATVTKYVGIPFASNPPVRFASPEPATKWKGVLQATATPPACIQQFSTETEQVIFNNPGGAYPAESEDCLYLNVYVPPGTTAKSALPVMFWIYGGDLAFGDGGLVMYDGSSYAANQGVILVTHNYRTNIFGFSMSPEIPLSERNAGFLDQRLALKWTYNNIKKFGGDPSKITIFGESAGGYSVEQILAYPPSESQFRAAIMESRGFSGPTNSNSSWIGAVAAAGCADAADVLTCMRSLTATDLQSSINGTAAEALAFGPVEDGATYISDIRPRLGNGAAKVPVMLGNNGQEGNVFAYLFGLDQPGANETDAVEALTAYFGGNSTLVELLLGGVDTADNTPYTVVADVITDYIFLCVTSAFATALQSAGSDVWRYWYNASFPDTSSFPNAYAFHSSEIPEVFGTYPVKNQLGKATKQQIALSQYMQTAWANFAKNPTEGPQEGWPQLGALSNVQNLGGDGSKGGNTILAASIDGSCAFYDTIIDVNGY